MKLQDRPQAEQEAIKEYMRVSHPSNLPKNVDTANWVFFKNRRTNKLDAGL